MRNWVGLGFWYFSKIIIAKSSMRLKFGSPNKREENVLSSEENASAFEMSKNKHKSWRYVEHMEFENMLLNIK